MWGKNLSKKHKNDITGNRGSQSYQKKLFKSQSEFPLFPKKLLAQWTAEY